MKLKEKRKINFVFLGLCAILILRLLSGNLVDKIRVTYLDVGQGAGVCISVNASSAVMIDGGSSSQKDINEYVITPYLKSYGIKEITHWFVTHSDMDHISGLLEFLSDYKNSLIKLDSIVLPRYRLEDENYDMIIKLANRNKIKITNISAGDSIKYHSDYDDELIMYCLAPSPDTALSDNRVVFKDHNEESEVLYFSYGQFQTLIMGDLPSEYDSSLIREIRDLGLEDNKIEVLQASHHGSKTGTSKELLDILRPDYCIISAGYNNSYGHPHSELLDRLNNIGTKYFITYETGAIIVSSNRKRMWIKTMYSLNF